MNPLRRIRLVLLLLAVFFPACGRLKYQVSPIDAATVDTSVVDSGVDLDVLPVDGPDDLSLGTSYGCAIRRGALSCWGDNASGGLGVGDMEGRNVPTLASPGTRWRSVGAGAGGTCALDELGAIWCWGNNANGQLGLGDRTSRSRPTPLGVGSGWRSISASFATVCAIASDRTLWCWGANAEGQIGQLDDIIAPDGLVPTRVGTDADWLEVGVGQGHACAIRQPGTLWCWGRNVRSELGLGAGAEGQIRGPQRVGAGEDWSAVVAGQSHSCGLRAMGELWCWGDNTAGQLGLGATPKFETPTRVGDVGTWFSLTSDTFHTCAIQRGGTLYCWGRNDEGQLGHGDTAQRTAPTAVGVDTDWLAVDVGRFHSCARKSDRRVFCTGENVLGELGLGDVARRSAFTAVALPAL